MSEVVGEALVVIKKDTSQLGDFSKSGEEAGGLFGSGLSKIMGKLPAIAGVAAAGALVSKTFLSALNLDAGAKKMQAQLGLTEEESQQAGKVAGQLYADNFGDSMSEVQESVGTVIASIKGMRNANEADLKAATQAALEYTGVFDEDLPEAVNQANTLINSGLAKNTTQAFDLMTAAAQKVPESLRGDLGDAVSEYSKHFAMLGLSGKQAFSVLVAGADQGTIGIDKAGDAVKEFGIRATDISDTNAQAAFKAIGLNAKQMADDILTGGATAQKATAQVAKGILAIKDPSQQALIATQLFGTQMEDLGKDNVKSFLTGLSSSSDALGKVAGATQRASDTMNDTPLVQIQALWRKLSATLSQFALKAMGPVVDGFRWLGTEVSTLVPVVQTALEPVLAQIGATLSGSVLPALQSFGGYFQTTIMPVLAELGSVFKTSILPVFAALAEYVYGQLYPALVQLYVTIAQQLKPVFDALFTAFKTQILPALQQLSDQIRTQLLPVLEPLITKLLRVVIVAAKIAAVILGVLLPPLIKLVAWLLVHVIPVIAQTIIIVVRIISALVRFGSAVGTAVGALGRFGRAASGLVSGAMSELVSAVAAVPGRLAALGGRFASVGRSIIGQFIRAFKGGGSLVSDIAGKVWDVIKDSINSAIDHLNSALTFDINIGPVHKTISAPNIHHLQAGSRDTAAGYYTVGEVGPERVYLPEGARVMTAAQTKQAAGAGDLGDLVAALGAALKETAAAARPVSFSLPTGDPEAVAMAVVNRLARV